MIAAAGSTHGGTYDLVADEERMAEDSPAVQA